MFKASVLEVPRQLAPIPHGHPVVVDFNDLLCPVCGGNNLHMARRLGMVHGGFELRFSCEGDCGPLVLTIETYKGSTMLNWRRP